MGIRQVRGDGDDVEGHPIRYIAVTHDVSFGELQSWAVSQAPGDYVAVSVEHGGLSQGQVREAVTPHLDLTDVAADEDA